MEAKEIAFWASEMVQELSRLGDYSVEAKAIRETLERARPCGLLHYPLVPPFHRRVVTRPSPPPVEDRIAYLWNVFLGQVPRRTTRRDQVVRQMI